MASDYTIAAVGALVCFFGIALVAWHIRHRRSVLGNPAVPASDLNFYAAQYRRRMQTSALTIALGALISLCDYPPIFQNSPAFAATYIIGLLLLALWLVLLALGDAFASRIHMSQSHRRNRQNGQSIQQAVDELRRKQTDEQMCHQDEVFVSASRR